MVFWKMSTLLTKIVLNVAEPLNAGRGYRDFTQIKMPKGAKPIIAKFISHKVKAKLYKACTNLKSVKISDLNPGYTPTTTK